MGNAKYQGDKSWGLCINLFLLFLLASLHLNGQEEVLHFHRLSVEHNLSSQTYNWYVFKDSEGFVWVSSINGLNRFDGKEVVQYHPNSDDTLSLAGSNIQSRFFEDTNNNLWFTTTKAIHKYNRKNNHFQRYFIEENGQRIEGDYQLFYLDTLKENLWVEIDDKLFIYSVKEAKDSSFFLGNIPMGPYSQVEQSSGSFDFDKIILITSKSGLYARGFKDYEEVWKSHFLNSNEPGHLVSTLYFENDEQVWVGADTGLIELNLVNNNERLFRNFNGKAITDIKSIAPFGNDILIIATIENGIFFFDKNKRQYIKQLFSIEAERIAPFQQVIEKIYVDQDNTLWISCVGRGLYYVNLNKNKFSTFLQNPLGNPSKINNVKSITEGLDGKNLVLYLGRYRSYRPLW